MIEKIEQYVKEHQLNFYDVAVMTKDGIKCSYFQPGCKCNASYSIAKLFISTAIGVLIDKSLISEDDKITDILRKSLTFSYDPIWDGVTVRHALTHRIGIDYGVLDVDRDSTEDYGILDFLRLILTYQPRYQPGMHYCYSDVPSYLLSRVISEITGSSADTLINDKIQVPLSFQQTAWSRCPMNYTIGGTGAFMSASDLVKLAWVYLKNGTYNGKRIISESWVRKAEENHYELDYVEGTKFIGKGGMYGQMVMYHKEKNIAIAWHAYEDEIIHKELIPYLESIL